MKVTIYCGIPGSGKSTIVAREHPNAIVCSADKHFMRTGIYRFNLAELPEAHGSCLRSFVANLHLLQNVVDNTNTTIAELAPYAALALAYGAELDIVTIECTPRIAWARNVHDVPLATCEAMHRRLNAREMPPWWNHRTVQT